MSFSNRTWNMWHMTLALKGKYEYNLMCEKIYAVLNDYQYMAAALLRTPPNVFPIFYNETGWTFTGMKWVCFGISCMFLLNIIWNWRKIAFQTCEKTMEHGIIIFHPLYFIPKNGLDALFILPTLQNLVETNSLFESERIRMFATIHNIQTPWTYKLCTWPPCIIHLHELWPKDLAPHPFLVLLIPSSWINACEGFSHICISLIII